MRFRELVRTFASRGGLQARPTERFLHAFFGELIRQLTLGEELRLPLGRFKLVPASVRPKRTNLLTGGRVAVPRSRCRINFKQKKKTDWDGLAALALVVDTQLEGIEVPETRKKKKRKMVVEVPDDVDSVTIEFKKKKKDSESETGKKRLLG